MSIRDEVKTTRGWPSLKIGCTRVRPFADARRYFQKLLNRIDDGELCMFEITITFLPKAEKIRERQR